MKRLLGIILVAVLAFTSVGCFMSKSVVNYHDQPLQLSDSSVTMKKIDKAIIQAGAKRGWVMKKVAEGHMIGTLNVRVHMVQVDVKYNTESFSIDYRNSSNLEYNPEKGTIHRNYNTWVLNLRNDIQATVPLTATE